MASSAPASSAPASSAPASSAPASSCEELHISFAKNMIAGSMAVPVCLALQHRLPHTWVPLALFCGSAYGNLVSTFIECVSKNQNWKVTVLESLLALGSFILGGLFPMLVGMLTKERPLRIAMLVLSCALVTFGTIIHWRMRTTEGGDGGPEDRRRTTVWIGWIWLIAMLTNGVFVTVADLVK